MTSFRKRLASALIVLAALAGADFGIHRVRHQFDLTAEHSQTLTDQTVEIVQRIHQPVKVSVFFARGDPDRVSAASLLLRYRRLNRRIDFRLIDPAQAPAEAERLGIDPVFGGLAVMQDDHLERASTPTEQDMTAALARLLRGKPSSVCLTSGHGEASAESTLGDGFTSTASLLAQNGYRLQTIDLLTSSEVPSSCEAIIVANPTAPLGTAESGIGRYLAAAGRALILADPASTVNLNDLLRPYGLGIERGIVLENDPDLHFPDDPARPVIVSYRSSLPFARRLPPAFFPGAEAITMPNVHVSGLSVAGLAQTSPRSYLEREPLQPSFDSKVDIPGPITLAAGADLSGNFEGKVRRTRVMVFGDVDFASNAFLNEAGNSTLLIRALDWAIIEEELVTVSANLPAVRPLELTEGRISYARFLLAGVVPGLFLLGGAGVWAARRSR